MSQKNPSDGGQKGFAVGRGLLAAAETLNFSMNEQRSGPQGRPMGNMVSGMGLGGGMDSQDRNSQMARRGGGSHLGSTMRMNISVETLPHRRMQPKSWKGHTGDRHMAGRNLPSMSPETSYGGRGGRDGWDDMHGGRMGGPSMGQSSARGQSQANYGYGSMQSANSSRGYDFGYGGMFPHVCALWEFDVHSNMVSTSPGSSPCHFSLRVSLFDIIPRLGERLP